MIFDYPEQRNSRRHGPDGYADYESFRDWLRDEFCFRCIYCLKRESWGRVTGDFELDHFEPQAINPDKALSYENLVYACRTCNSIKSAATIADPFQALHSSKLRCDFDGCLVPSSKDAYRLIEILDLNSPQARRCPLWTKTVNELMPLVNNRAPSENVFLNRSGKQLTRFGVHGIVEKYAAQVAKQLPSVGRKRVSPHIIRHTTATHLLRAGVDINTIRAWLGHVSITTTNVYAEVDLEMKMKALENCEVQQEKPQKPWRDDKGLMEFLKAL